MNKIALAIHGGAGTILRSTMTPELEREYRDGLEDALEVGWQILSDGGSALGAVERTVSTLEDFHLFNAGHGSVFTHEGRNEMDASIMDGKTLNAGAIAFVRNVKNPVKLARMVMDRSPHILLAGEGANEFAKEMGLEFAPDEYFFTEHRWKQLQDSMERGTVDLDHSASGEMRNAEGGMRNEDVSSETSNAEERIPQSAFRKPHSKGTVGAVACDRDGNLAAATSTGGMTNKQFGRVGDTASFGAGTYADNQTCAVSCTGHGEFFMVGVTAYDIAARMKYKNLRLENAAAEALDHLTKIGGEGGFIAVDSRGEIVLRFNSEGMYRGWQNAPGEAHVEIY